MKKKSILLLLAVLLLSMGCATYDIDRLQKHPAIPKLDKTASAYVCVCEDGRYKSKIYRGSGMATAQIITDIFSKYLGKASRGEFLQTCDEALKTALYSGHRYLICPSILQWEDHETHITEVRDKVSIKVILIDTLTGTQLDSVLIKGKGRFVSVGGEKPQDLLATPVRIYLDSLF